MIVHQIAGSGRRPDRRKDPGADHLGIHHAFSPGDEQHRRGPAEADDESVEQYHAAAKDNAALLRRERSGLIAPKVKNTATMMLAAAALVLAVCVRGRHRSTAASGVARALKMFTCGCEQNTV